jgi:DNA-binding XRE family transcriptional regulator
VLTGATTEYIDPDAPKRAPDKRTCDKCACKVSSYTEPYEFHGTKEQVLLCGPCDVERRYSDAEDALAFVGRDSERMRKRKAKRARENERKKRDNEKHRTLPAYVALPNLRDIREAKGVTQTELARKVGVQQTKLSALELGKHRVRRQTARAIARKLGAKMSDMGVAS